MTASTPTSNDNASSGAKLLATIGWPGLVVALLLGHATVMMVAVTLGRTNTGALEEVESYHTDNPLKADKNHPGGDSP